MKTFVACVAIIVSLSGCFSESHVSNSSRMESVTLADAAGVYENEGMLAGGGEGPLLTEVLLPGFSSAEKADAVRLVVLDAHSVRCEALAGGVVLVTKTYVEGKDFRLNRDEVPIDKHFTDMGSSQSQSLALAAGTSSRTLYLTTAHDIVLRTRSKAGALVFMIVPVGLAEVSDVTYRRVSPNG